MGRECYGPSPGALLTGTIGKSGKSECCESGRRFCLSENLRTGCRPWLDLVLSVAWSFAVKPAVLFCSSISELLFDNLEICKCHNTLFLISPYLRFIKGLIRDLFVFL